MSIHVFATNITGHVAACCRTYVDTEPMISDANALLPRVPTIKKSTLSALARCTSMGPGAPYATSMTMLSDGRSCCSATFHSRPFCSA